MGNPAKSSEKRRPLLIALSAGLGGIFTNLFELATKLTSGPSQIPGITYISTYSLGLLIFALLGSAVALVFKESDIKKAFFLGLGLPAFIQLNASAYERAKGGGSGAPRKAPQAVGASLGVQFYLFSTPVYAQDSDLQNASGSPRVQNRDLTLSMVSDVAQFGEVLSFSSARIVFYSKDRTETRAMPVSLLKLRSQEGIVLKIPAFASSFHVRIGRLRSNEIFFEDNVSASSAELEVARNSWSGFWNAIGFKDSAALELILDKVSSEVERPNTVADGEYTEALRELKTRGVDIGLDSLVSAVKKSDKDLVSLLLDAGVSTNSRTKDGSAVLHIAILEGADEIVRLLLLDPATDIEVATRNGRPPLLLGISEGHVGIVDLLLAAGANPNIQSPNGLLPLAEASVRGHAEVVRLLLVAGAQVDARDKDGDTALIAAAKGSLPGAFEVAQLLLEFGADISITNDKLMSAQRVAIKNNNIYFIRALRAHGKK